MHQTAQHINCKPLLSSRTLLLITRTNGSCGNTGLRHIYLENNAAPADADGTVALETVRSDSRRLPFLVQIDTESPSRRVLVFNTAHSHSRSRLHSATFHILAATSISYAQLQFNKRTNYISYPAMIRDNISGKIVVKVPHIFVTWKDMSPLKRAT